MKIWGTVSPWVEVEQESLLMGRFVANNEFIKALFDYSDFDEYHFYVFNDYFRRITVEFFEKESSAVNKNIRVFLKKELPINLKNIDYFVFHQGGWYGDNPALLNLRDKYAKSYFPVTGIIHSINDFNTLQQSIKYISAGPKEFDSIVSTSTAGKKALLNYFREAEKNISREYSSNVDIIPLAYPNDFDKVKIISKQDARAQLKIEKDRFTIIYLGRLSLSTKLDLANMLFSLKDFVNSKNINLILAGGASKSDINNLESVINAINFPKDKLKVFYNFHHTLKSVLYLASDIFISPVDNLQETFGITVPEAKFFGTIPIVSDWNGYKDTVNDGVDGYKIPTYSFSDDGFSLDEMYELIGLYDYHYTFSQTVYINYNIMIEKIETLMIDDKLRKKMSMNARGHSRKFYSWKTVMKQYVELWDKLHNLSLKYKKEKVLNDNMQIKFRNIFQSYFQDINSNIKISDNWKENYKIMSSMYLQYFFREDEISKLIKKIINNKINFNLLTSQEKGVGILLLKWKVAEIED